MNDRLTEIRERCEKATEGPWENDGCLCVSVFVPTDGIWKNDICECDDLLTENGQANTEFIANAREDIPYLLSEIERLTKERDAAVEDLYEIGKCDTCKKHHGDCDLDTNTGICHYEWRGAKT